MTPYLSTLVDLGFVAFAYEDICKNIFIDLCKNGTISLVPSRIGSYWLSDYDGDTEIDVMAVDHQNKRIFADVFGLCYDCKK